MGLLHTPTRTEKTSRLGTLQQRGSALVLGLALMGLPSLSGRAEESKATEVKVKPDEKVSYYRVVRPILQAN